MSVRQRAPWKRTLCTAAYACCNASVRVAARAQTLATRPATLTSFASLLMMPAWKKEGYAEYIGGETLSYDAGVKLWKANPKDATGYQYFKYMMLVKYLLETEKLSVDDLFNRDFDLNALEEKVLRGL